jgi:hypothetical protein
MQYERARMAKPIPPFELSLQIALLPPLSRGEHLAGPRLHAQRLVELWQVAADDDVPLAEAFRLLDMEAVEGAIWRVTVARERKHDPRYWTFPEIEELLPKLRELAWQRMLAGTLLVEANKGLRGKRYRTVLSTELPRLVPDWRLSRLMLSGRDEFIDVHVQRAPMESTKKAWRKSYADDELKTATEAVAQTCGPGEQPSFGDFWKALQRTLKGVTRRQAQHALRKFAPRLRGRPGYRSTKPLS